MHCSSYPQFSDKAARVALKDTQLIHGSQHSNAPLTQCHAASTAQLNEKEHSFHLTYTSENCAKFYFIPFRPWFSLDDIPHTQVRATIHYPQRITNQLITVSCFILRSTSVFAMYTSFKMSRISHFLSVRTGYKWYLSFSMQEQTNKQKAYDNTQKILVFC